MAKNLTHYTKDDDNEQVVKSKANVKQNLPQLNKIVASNDSPINPNKVTQSRAKELPRQTAESVPVSVASLVGSNPSNLARQKVEDNQNLLVNALRSTFEKNTEGITPTAVSSLVGSNATEEQKKDAEARSRYRSSRFWSGTAESAGEAIEAVQDVASMTKPIEATENRENRELKSRGFELSPEDRYTNFRTNPIKQLTQWSAEKGYTDKFINSLNPAKEALYEKAEDTAQRGEEYGQRLTPFQRGTADLLANVEQNVIRDGIALATGNALGFGTGVISDLMMGLPAYGAAIRDAKEKGLEGNEARKYALLSAGIEVGSEHMFDIGGVNGYSLGLEDIIADQIDNSFARPFNKYLMHEAASVLTEGGEEFFASLASDARDKAMLGQDKELGQALSDAGSAFMQGALSALILSGARGDISESGYNRYKTDLALQYLRMSDTDRASVLGRIAELYDIKPELLEKEISKQTNEALKDIEPEVLFRAINNTPVAEMNGMPVYEYTGQRNKDQKTALKMLKRMGNAYLAEDLGNDKKGAPIAGVTLQDGTVLVSARATDPVSWVTAHEGVHRARGTEGWDKFITDANRYMREAMGDEFDSWFNDLTGAYAQYYTEVGAPDMSQDADTIKQWFSEKGREKYETDTNFKNKIDEEVAAYYVQRHLLHDNQAMKRFLNTTGNVAQQVFQSIKDTVSGFGNDLTEEQKAIADMEQRYAKLIAEQKGYKSDTKYALDAVSEFTSKFGETEDGRVRPTDPNALTNEDWKTIQKALDKLGYGLGSAQTAKEVYSRYVFDNGFNAEQSDAIRKAFGVAKSEQKQGNPVRARQAKAMFGTTGNFDEAGYLLQDGSMLDFSGKRDGGAPGRRAMDHRDINAVFDEEGNGTQSWFMDKFIDEGNVRLMPEQGATIGEIEPNAKQYSVLKKFVDHLLDTDGYFYLDLSNANGITVASREYTKADSGNKVINDIKAYFKNGELPYRSEFADYRYALSPDFAQQYMDAVNRNDMETAENIRREWAEQQGYDRESYHGTMNGGFTVFDKQYANPEGNSGAGFYSTTDFDDADDHYRDAEGADNYFKRSALAEQILDAGEWNGEPVEDYDTAYQIATDELNQNPEVYNLAFRTENPYIRDFDNSTSLDLMSDALEFAESSIDREDYDNEDDYNDDLYNYAYENLSETVDDAVWAALRSMEDNYEDVDFPSTERINDLVGDIALTASDYGGVTFDDIYKAVADDMPDISVLRYNGTQFDNATGELTRAIIENLGYDSIIDREVDRKFNQLIQASSGAEHYIAFDPSQYKLSDTVTYDDNGNIILPSERFNPESNDIRYSLVGTSPDGIEQYRTDFDENVDYATRIKAANKIVQDQYGGVTIKFINDKGDVSYASIRTNDKGRKELIRMKKGSDNSGWRAKINTIASGDLLDLTNNMQYVGTSDNKGEKHSPTDTWDYYLKTVNIDGRNYDVLANIQKQKGDDDGYLYSVGVTENKKISPNNSAPKQDSSGNNGVSSNLQFNNTTQNPNVNNGAMYALSPTDEDSITQDSMNLNSEDNREDVVNNLLMQMGVPEQANAYPMRNNPQDISAMRALGDIDREMESIDPERTESVNPSEWEAPSEYSRPTDFLTDAEAESMIDEWNNPYNPVNQYIEQQEVNKDARLKDPMENQDVKELIDGMKEDGVSPKVPTMEETEMYQSIVPDKKTGAMGGNRGGARLGMNTLEQFFDAIAGKNTELREKLRDIFERPRFNSKTIYTENIDKIAKEVDDMVKKTGIKGGTKESAAVQWYGEGVKKENGKETEYTLDDLKHDFPQKWEDIVELNNFFREKYNEYVDRLNEVLKQIYPDLEIKAQTQLDTWRNKIQTLQDENSRSTNEQAIAYREKQIRQLENKIADLEKRLANGDYFQNKRLSPRDNYFMHFQDMQKTGLGAIKDLLSVGKQGGRGNISTELVGVSEHTKPRSRWLSQLQHRNDGEYTADAVTGFIKYANALEYAIAFDPLIAQYRDEISKIVKATSKTRNANTLIQYLTLYTNQLAGKTSPLDRQLLDFLNGGTGNREKFFSAIESINSRGKAAAVVMNPRSALSQFGNIPNAKSVIKSEKAWMKGLKDFFGNRKLLEQSPFLAERYGGFTEDDYMARDTIGKKLKGSSQDFANWMMEIGDKLSTEWIWLSAYNQALDKKVSDPIFYADDLTRRSVAGRGIGEVPFEMKSRTMGLFAPFQTEANNQWQNLKGMVRDKDARGVFRLMANTYIMNLLYSTVFGFTVLPDLAEVIVDGIRKLFDKEREESTGEVIGETVSRLGGETLSMMPGVTNWLPFLIGSDNSEKMFGESDPTRYGTGSVGLSTVGSLVGDVLQNLDDVKKADVVTPALQLGLGSGGRLASRFYNTLQDFNVIPSNGAFNTPFGGEKTVATGDYTKSGALKYRLPELDNIEGWDDVGEIARAFAFGSNATKEAQEYFENGKPALSKEKVAKLKEHPEVDVDNYIAYTHEADLDKSGGISQYEADKWIRHHNLSDEEAQALWEMTNDKWAAYDKYTPYAERFAEQQLKNEFKAADTDKSGSITQKELVDWFATQDLTEDEKRKMWNANKWDTNYDDYMAKQGDRETAAKRKELNDAANTDGKGTTASQAEVYAYLNTQNLTDEEKEALWALMGWKTDYATYASKH